jgi:hypothetical protein
MRNETPDAWIERRPEDNAPDPADCCQVCGVYDDCVCPDEEPEADFLIQNEGTIYLFRPMTAAAEEHLRDNVGEEAQWFGGALVVEHRYARDLAAALNEEGFTLQPYDSRNHSRS